MSAHSGVKQGAWAAALTILTEGALLPVLAWGGAEGWIDGLRPLPPLLLAAAIGAAAGAWFLRRRRWGALAAALVTGLGVQVLLMGTGWLAFGTVSWEGERWLLPIVAFGAALLVGLLPNGKKAGRKTARPRGRRRR